MTISKIINKTKAISIDWQLSNVCNFDCPYCVDSSKNGKSGWPDFDSCIEVVNTFTEYGLCEFSFSGGELTMWKNLPELFDYIKSKNHKIHLITNGYKAGRYWSKINADIITFSWHPSSNIDVLKWTDNVNLCHIQKRVWVLAYPKLWTKVVVDFNNLKKYEKEFDREDRANRDTKKETFISRSWEAPPPRPPGQTRAPHEQI